MRFEREGSFPTLIDLVRWRALSDPQHAVFRFLVDGDDEQVVRSHAELDRRARAIATVLRSRIERGGRALLLYPPGLEFLDAFLGCLYAGVVAVPAYPPEPTRMERSVPRLRAIIRDAEPALVLTTSLGAMLAHGASEALGTVPMLATDTVADVEATGWRDPGIAGDALAMLQYTSGSTDDPKGVMLTHANLLDNQHAIQAAFGHDDGCTCVSWLPIYHDMGLIGQVLQPLFVGGRSVLMSPLAFLQRPIRWLRAITRYRATLSTAPNFAYELCVRRIPREERVELDLRSWKEAVNGSEPIAWDTLDRFAEAFAPHGFDARAFYPVYGLAEATLLVSGGPVGRPASVLAVDAGELQDNRVVPVRNDGPAAKRVVACGSAAPGVSIRVVDPVTRRCCAPDVVGEIWVAGGGVGMGYWHRADETARTFQAFTADTGEGPFLRTGDLGVVRDGLLYVTGRLKDLIIVRGRNHYPHDIERTAGSGHPGLRVGCGAAVGLDVNGEERLLIVHEVESREPATLDVGEVFSAVRQAIAAAHDLQVEAILLLARGTLPKTSSGKVRRYACRQLYLDGASGIVGRWHAPNMAARSEALST